MSGGGRFGGVIGLCLLGEVGIECNKVWRIYRGCLFGKVGGSGGGSGFQPFAFDFSGTWGVAPGWYGVGPLALESALGGFELRDCRVGRFAPSLYV